MRISRLLAVALICLEWKAVQAQVTWRRSYGGYGIDEGFAVQQTTDGNYIVCGSTGSFGAGVSDIYLLLLDSFGELLWSRTIGGSGVDRGRAIKETQDGGFIIAGMTNSFGAGGYDGYVVKTDLNGIPEWSKAYGGVDWDMFNALDVLTDGYVMSGTTFASTTADLWIVRIDLDGDTVWTRIVGDSGNDEAMGVRATAAGGCVVAGSITTPGGISRAALLCLNVDGSDQWLYSLGSDSIEVGYDVEPTMDGGFVFCGSTMLYGTHTAFLIRKVDQDGNFLWEETYPQTAGDLEPRAMAMRSDGGFALAGRTTAFGFGGEEAYLMLVNDTGGFEVGTTYGTSDDDMLWSVDTVNDGGFILAGRTAGAGPGPLAVMVIKTDTSGFTITQTVEPELDPLVIAATEFEHLGYGIYPNPATGQALITLTGLDPTTSYDLDIHDATGRIMLSTHLTAGEQTLALNGLSSGIYLVQLRCRGVRVASMRLCIE